MTPDEAIAVSCLDCSGEDFESDCSRISTPEPPEPQVGGGGIPRGILPKMEFLNGIFSRGFWA
jgi:hypothetical protein